MDFSNKKYLNLFFRNNRKRKEQGFSIVELITVISILLVLVAISVPVFLSFQKTSSLNDSTEKLISILRIAQNKTLASENASQFGVYFDDSVSPHQYTLFEGSNYAGRIVSSDKIYELSKEVEFFEIDLNGGDEVVFDRITGITSYPGNVSLRLKNDNTKISIVYIEGFGQIGQTIPFVPTGGRSEDSRHVHFDYVRNIDTAVEIMTLSFDGGLVTQDISIINNIEGSEFSWEGEVVVGGETQEIKIHTHSLNTPNTEFCIHRSRDINTKSLDITLSGDASGNIIQYSSNGLIVDTTSIYAQNIDWQ
ncbi:MAG: prepilin-type N-terminal cleavage/methylation domain-containing protein [Patescibacteria group bacterium]